MINLGQALTLLEGRKEFAVVRSDGLVSVNYLVQMPDSFQGLRVNFRGVTFDEATGELLSLPLHKFFNVNQCEETQWDKLRYLEAEVYEKLDGSMVHFFRHRGELLASTRMSASTFQAAQAMKLAQKLGLLDLIVGEVDGGYTPIFEYVAPENQIVVEYPRPRLVYLNSRNRTDGKYRLNPAFPDQAKRFDIPFATINESLIAQRDFEGYVCHLSNGQWVKAKCPWYLERHRAVDAMMRPAYRLYEVVFQGAMDDLISLAPDKHKERLRAIYVEAQSDFLSEKVRIEGLAKSIRARLYSDGQVSTLESNPAKDKTDRELRKVFACYVQKHHADDMGPLMSAFLGNDLTDGLHKRLIEGYKAKYPRRFFADMEEA